MQRLKAYRAFFPGYNTPVLVAAHSRDEARYFAGKHFGLSPKEDIDVEDAADASDEAREHGIPGVIP